MLGKDLKVSELYKRLIPIVSEIVESGALATVLLSVNVPQKYIAIFVLVKGVVKSYLLRNARIKEPSMNEDIMLDGPVASETSDQVKTGTLSLDDRIESVVDYFNGIIRKNCKHPGFTKESVAPQVKEILTKSEEEIAKEAVAQLSPLQRKVLKV